MHGIQAWVALPKEDEETGPSFTHHGPDDLPTYEGGGMWARLIAGKAFGTEARGKPHSPMFYVHWRLDAGAKAQLGAEYSERAAFVVSGEVEVDGRSYGAGKMLVFSGKDPVLFTAVTPAVVMLLALHQLGVGPALDAE